jgi:hypothetical protein
LSGPVAATPYGLVDRTDRLDGHHPHGPAGDRSGRDTRDRRTPSGQRRQPGRELGRVLEYGGRRGSDLGGRQLGQVRLPARERLLVAGQLQLLGQRGGDVEVGSLVGHRR